MSSSLSSPLWTLSYGNANYCLILKLLQFASSLLIRVTGAWKAIGIRGNASSSLSQLP